MVAEDDDPLPPSGQARAPSQRRREPVFQRVRDRRHQGWGCFRTDESVGYTRHRVMVGHSRSSSRGRAMAAVRRFSERWKEVECAWHLLCEHCGDVRDVRVLTADNPDLAHRASIGTTPTLPRLGPFPRSARIGEGRAPPSAPVLLTSIVGLDIRNLHGGQMYCADDRATCSVPSDASR